MGSATDGTAPVSYAERSLAAGLYHWLALVAVALAALVADQTTKEIVLSQLGLGEAVHVVGPLSLHHVQNSGIAFGLFSAWGAIVTLITGGAVVWMLVYFARAGARHPVLPVALGLLIGGSAGNLADRIRLGHVTDFVDLRYWPAFNLADTFICVGVAVLVATALAGERAPRHPRRPRRAAPERA